MDILVPDNWLRNFLKTEAKPKKLAELLSFCGPSVDRIEKKGKEYIYHIEITTNRVDAASIYGIAREANAILPRFGVKASLAKVSYKPNLKFSEKVEYLDAKVDRSLCPRFTAVLIKGVEIKASPSWMKERLTAVGVRPINNVVDISNYIMHELGQPVHTFDYNKIKGKKMILRGSKKGEKITTLDGETLELPGWDIVIEDGERRLIDLAGIMGAKNSEVGKDTEDILLFVQTYNPTNIRKTSMTLAKRTEAAALFEKGLDPENVTLGIGRGIELFKKLTGGKPRAKILDLYKSPYKTKLVETNLEFINKTIGIDLAKKRITDYLEPLGFETTWSEENLEVKVPSFRSQDIDIPEDIVEEIARIHGYHNLPSELMGGKIPFPLDESSFDFEKKLKDLLRGWGGIEVYTYSMVSKNQAGEGALRLTNPLGKESEYMRTSLMPSLVAAAKENRGEKEPYHLFEMANVYIPRKGKLPKEVMTLAGIFSNCDYREAKGIIEALLSNLNIRASIEVEEKKGFKPARRLTIKKGNAVLGEFGILETNNCIYYEFELEKLLKAHNPVSPYVPVPKYPAQIEDITFVIPPKTKVGEIIKTINDVDKLVGKTVLQDIYKDAYTFRVWYRHPRKTLTDKEVEKVREKIISEVRKKHGAKAKD
jgi:phenylalanyl-tRNA synthetase beta chain